MMKQRTTQKAHECNVCSSPLIKAQSTVLVCEDCLRTKLEQQASSIEHMHSRLQDCQQRLNQLLRRREVDGRRITNVSQRAQRLKHQQQCNEGLKARVKQTQEECNRLRTENSSSSLANSTVEGEYKEAVRVLKKTTNQRKLVGGAVKQQHHAINSTRAMEVDRVQKSRRRNCRNLFKVIPISLHPIRGGYEGNDDEQVLPIDIPASVNNFEVFKLYVMSEDLWIPILLPSQTTEAQNVKSEATNGSSSTNADVNNLPVKEIVRVLLSIEKIEKNGFAQIGKALSFIVFVVNAVSKCLSIPLPHNMKHFGSNCTIGCYGKNIQLPLYYHAGALTQQEQTTFQSAMKEMNLQTMVDLFTAGISKLNENIVHLCTNQGILVSAKHVHNFAFNMLCLYHIPNIGVNGPFTYYKQIREDPHMNVFINFDEFKALDDHVLACTKSPKREKAQVLIQHAPSQHQRTNTVMKKYFDVGYIQADFYNENHIQL